MIIAFIALGFYVLMLLSISVAWRHIPLQKYGSEMSLKVSVVIPFRNESGNLEQLVKDLRQQSYDHFEVIFVNDHSTDQGGKQLFSLLESSSLKARILHLEEKQGKKMALSHGIEMASGEIIVTTDADCRFGRYWLKTLLMPFSNEHVQMVAGPVYLTGGTFWQRMQSIEFSALIGVGGALINLKRPTMANGANLAYRKAAFLAVDGFENISNTPSGDDELLMDKFHRIKNYRVSFAKDKEAWGATDALSNVKDFKHQRLRWAGKWRVKSRFNTIFAALIVFVIQLAQVYLYYFFLSHWMDWEGLLAVILLLLKGGMEYEFIRSVRKSHGDKTSSLVFTACYLIYPFYVLYIGIASNIKQFEWKGRIYDR